MTGIILLAGFAAGAAYSYHRWSARGLALFCIALIAFDVVRGTVASLLPHRDGAPRPWDWPCHATGAFMSVLLLGVSVLAALHLTRALAPSLLARMSVALLTCVVLAVPVAMVLIWWGVDVLACDTL